MKDCKIVKIWKIVKTWKIVKIWKIVKNCKIVKIWKIVKNLENCDPIDGNPEATLACESRMHQECLHLVIVKSSGWHHDNIYNQ